MKVLLRVAMLLSLSFFSFSAWSQVEEDVLLEPIRKVFPDFEVGDIELTPIPGIYKVHWLTEPTGYIYMSEDGKYFFDGKFLEVAEDRIVDLGEKAMEKERLKYMESLATEELIVFGAEEPKATVYVFTDVDCYYCQKLHLEVPALTALGVQIRYLAYPRAGIGSPSYNKIASAWCADDPNDALTKLKAGEAIPENVCEDNPVPSQFALGGKVGVRGTPALITETGRLLPGYMPAKKLAAELGIK